MISFGKLREWVYPAQVRGRFQRLHRWTGALLVLFLYGVPWLTIGGRPAFRFDLPGRRLFALGATFTAKDTLFLVFIGLFTTLSLFLLTSLFGRIWCGYACPQTVFLEEWIRPVERWIEGDRGVRRARDLRAWRPFFGNEGKNGLDKAWRKALKLSAFALISGVVSLGALAWFSGGPETWTGRAGAGAYGVAGFVAIGLFLDFAWFREQFCNYLCPYARFQGALTDDHSLVIGYNAPRGEPRGKESAQLLKQRTAAAALLDTPNLAGRIASAPEGASLTVGDCIDCGRCVAVCPQGIDIRDGYQLECVNCARCVDACGDVMGKLGHASLVSYTTVAASEGGKTRWMRPRNVAYAAALATIATIFVARLGTRHDFEAFISRAPGTLFNVGDDGSTRNTYIVRIADNGPNEHVRTYTFSVDGLPGAILTAPQVELRSTESTQVPLVVSVPKGVAVDRTVALQVRIQATDAEGSDDALTLDTNFKSAAATGQES